MAKQDNDDMLLRLRADAGTRTFGELTQEREWAYQEIMSLRERVNRYASPPQTQRSHQSTETGSGVVTRAKYTGVRYLRLREVCERVGLRTSTVYSLIKLGKFPMQVKLSEKASAWIESEVEAYMDARIAERDESLAAKRPIDSPYMRMGEVMKLTGLKSSELYDLIRAGKFPKWAKLPKIASGWVRNDVDVWIATRNAAALK